MAPKKVAVTSKALQSLLTRIGSASSGTKSTLLARFQRDVQRSGFSCTRDEHNAKVQSMGRRKLRIVSIDMGIKNLAFCDAEVSYDVTAGGRGRRAGGGSGDRQDFGAHMDVLRWKKLDLIESAYSKTNLTASEDGNATNAAADAETDLFSPSVLSKTAYHLIVQEVLSVRPDIILIEKQRWRSGGGSAVQQWTVRVNTLEAMLWAVLETLRHGAQSHGTQDAWLGKQRYHVYAVDPKRVGQYWLGQHARALHERDEADAVLDIAAFSGSGAETADTSERGGEEEEEEEEEEGEMEERDDATQTNAVKKPSRSKAEKSAKIAVLRSWLADNHKSDNHSNNNNSSTEYDTHSTAPSTPTQTPRITFSIAPSAAGTRAALLRTTQPSRRRKTAGAAGPADAGMSAAETRKLDDVTDCFLQAAAWVAWEANRVQLLAVGAGGDGDGDGDGDGVVEVEVNEERILGMMRVCGEV